MDHLQLIADRPLASKEPCVVCGRTTEEPLVEWFVSTVDGSLTCATCALALERIETEVSMRRQTIILAGPYNPATLNALLPLVTYAFDRLLGHLEGDGSRMVTLKQVQTIARGVCVEYGAEHLTDNVISAVNASIDSMLGGAVTDSEPVGSGE
jgi:hypothetical protein